MRGNITNYWLRYINRIASSANINKLIHMIQNSRISFKGLNLKALFTQQNNLNIGDKHNPQLRKETYSGSHGLIQQNIGRFNISMYYRRNCLKG
jgi:outer membrane receptor for Fe3+-dicitrate